MSEINETQETTARIIAEAATAAARAVSEAGIAAAKVVSEAATAAAKENNITLTEIAVLKTEMNIIKAQQSSFESEMNRRLDGLDPKFEKIFIKLDEIALGRPTWSVALIIGGLFSLCVGLIVFTVSHL